MLIWQIGANPYGWPLLCYIESTGELQAAEVGSIPTCDTILLNLVSNYYSPGLTSDVEHNQLIVISNKYL